MLFAIGLSLVSSFFVASKQKRWRFCGFCGFMISNLLWLEYGVTAPDKWIVLQFGVFLLSSVWGLHNNSVSWPEIWKGRKMKATFEITCSENLTGGMVLQALQNTYPLVQAWNVRECPVELSANATIDSHLPPLTEHQPEPPGGAQPPVQGEQRHGW